MAHLPAARPRHFRHQAFDRAAHGGMGTDDGVERAAQPVDHVRDAAVAKSMYERAKSLKFTAYTEKIDVANGAVTRVRVGPYATKQQAESARAKLAQAGFEAKVLTSQ